MNNELLHLIERIGTLHRSSRKPGAAAHGLQPVHVDILLYLSRCNRFSDTPSALTAHLGITKGTVSQSITLLEQRGLAKKVSDPKDRRVVHLALTAKGRKVLGDCILPSDWLVERLRPFDVAVSLRVLRTMLRTAQEEHGFQTFGECRTCRHLISEKKGGYRCGLTDEPLQVRDTEKICVEHELKVRD